MGDLWTVVARAGDGLPGWFLSMTLWTGLVLALAIVCDRLLRRHVSPSWRVLLFAAVFVRAALPVDWGAPLSVLGVAEQGVREAPTVAPAMAPALLSAARPDVEVTQVAPAVVGAPAVTLGHGLVGLYGLGVLLLLGRAAYARRRLRGDIDRAAPARSRVAALAPSNIRVLESATLGPLAFGVRDPAIVVPSAVVDALDDDELACVMAHERAHHRRRDPLLALGLSLVTAVLWPLLPVWIAAAYVRQLAELAADEHALSPGGARLYGETLLKLADRPRLRSFAGAGAALHLGGFASLRGRVLAVTRGGRRRIPGAVQGALAVTVAGTVLACAGVETSEPECSGVVETRDPECPPAPEAKAEPTSCEALKQEATTLHDKVEKGGDAAMRERAWQAYSEYADRCQSDPDHAEVVYYRAELMWSTASAKHGAGDKDGAKQDFARAHDAFVRALELGPSKFTKDAAYAQMLSKLNQLEVEDKPRAEERAGEVSADQGFAPTPYTDEERELLASYDRYMKYAEPGDKEVGKIRYRRARLAAQHNHFDEAEEHALALLGDDLDTPHHVWAAEIVTDVRTIAWVAAKKGSPDELRTARIQLQRWLERAPTLKCFANDDALALRDAVRKLTLGLQRGG